VIVPTKTLIDPIELERALQSGLAAASAVSSNGPSGFAFESDPQEMFPELYQVRKGFSYLILLKLCNSIIFIKF